jgi:hypothetical protein
VFAAWRAKEQTASLLFRFLWERRGAALTCISEPLRQKSARPTKKSSSRNFGAEEGFGVLRRDAAFPLLAISRPCEAMGKLRPAAALHTDAAPKYLREE